MNARRPLPSAVRNLRPTRTARFELMPGVVLYDHEADPDDVWCCPTWWRWPCR